jgi:hypothetical protein
LLSDATSVEKNAQKIVQVALARCVVYAPRPSRFRQIFFAVFGSGNLCRLSGSVGIQDKACKYANIDIPTRRPPSDNAARRVMLTGGPN